jgi:hypothetical protein
MGSSSADLTQAFASAAAVALSSGALPTAAPPTDAGRAAATGIPDLSTAMGRYCGLSSSTSSTGEVRGFKTADRHPHPSRSRARRAG